MSDKEKNENQEDLQKKLQDKVYVNYNLLAKLEEIKRVNYAIFESLNKLINKLEENPEREGTFKGK